MRGFLTILAANLVSLGFIVLAYLMMVGGFKGYGWVIIEYFLEIWLIVLL